MNVKIYSVMIAVWGILIIPCFIIAQEIQNVLTLERILEFNY